MTLETRVRDLAIRIGTEFNTVEGQIGLLANLGTTAQGDLVSAINEVLTAAGNAAVINDATASSTTTYSSVRIDADIAAAVASLVDSAPAALDTLAELATALTGNDTDIAAILTAQAERVAVTAQTFTAPQQLQARTNIGAQDSASIGDTDRDFVADFEGALTP